MERKKTFGCISEGMKTAGLFQNAQNSSEEKTQCLLSLSVTMVTGCKHGYHH